MTQPLGTAECHCEDLSLLRRLIASRAALCGLDVDDAATRRHLMDGNFFPCLEAGAGAESCRELQAMLVLLYRLEASSSEDIGVAGLQRLWHRLGEIIANASPRAGKNLAA